MRKKKTNIVFKLIFLVQILLVIVIFSPYIFLYFVQDDFFLLTISQAYSFGDFLKFFIPAEGVVWYRPLSSQFFFFILRSLFGLNPFPYHLVMFFTHLLNIWLVFKLSARISRSENIAILASLIYGTSSTHFITLAWLSTYSFILGPTFILLTLIFYLNQEYLKSLISFFLGLLTSEVVMWVIFPLLIWELIFRNERKLKKIVFTISPFLILILLILFLREVLYPVSYEEAYKIVINVGTILSLLRFYFFRTLGIPMLIRETSDILVKSIVLALSGVIFFFGIFIPRHKQRVIIFSLATYFSFLLLFLLLPNHYSPHYLTFSIIGISLFWGVVIENSRKTIKILFVICYVMLQFISVRMTYNTHWIVRRAHLAKKLIEEKRLIHPVGTEEYFALGANRAADLFK